MILVDLDAAGLERQRAELGAAATPFVADATAADTPARAFDAGVAVFGHVDALVNNVGNEGPIARVEDLELETVRRLFELNVYAMVAFTQEAVRRFRAQGRGRIVNMASGAGTAGSALMSAYSASKHAAVGLTRSVAVEVAAAGIQVNAVCPGCVDSPMMERIEARIGEIRGTGPASFMPSIPAGRYCDPAEVGELVAWLVLEAPDYITGTTHVIDGGMRA
jgi:NAD(P)-dependent dehydrogenase (short-subunit alcohol dehydrogenase family)